MIAVQEPIQDPDPVLGPVHHGPSLLDQPPWKFRATWSLPNG